MKPLFSVRQRDLLIELSSDSGNHTMDPETTYSVSREAKALYGPPWIVGEDRNVMTTLQEGAC